jgi:hypothetical protein
MNTGCGRKTGRPQNKTKQTNKKFTQIFSSLFLDLPPLENWFNLRSPSPKMVPPRGFTLQYAHGQEKSQKGRSRNLDP